MTNETIIKEERVSLVKRTKYLKNSIEDEHPTQLINFVEEIEHMLEIKLKKIEKEIDKKNITKCLDKR